MAASIGSIDSMSDDLIKLQLWSPEPLVPEVEFKASSRIITSRAGKYIGINGDRCLNFGTHNYLGLADDKRLEEAATSTVRKYGVGSCGPRAFYGTMDVHLLLEEELAKFLGVQETCLYAYGFSTIASAIPAYAKPGDIIFVDEQCNFAIQQGLIASKSTITKFRHNDMKHLEQLVQAAQKSQSKAEVVRTFLLVEGLYAKTGDLCPLKELIEIKKRYKIRLFIDESRSFGVLGSDGKGVTQHFNVDVNDIDLIISSLENALCAYGGFCAGSSYVVDHQRLSGTGYCFSASLPPFQCQVARESLKIIRENPSIVREAQETFCRADEILSKLTKLKNVSSPLSPIKLLVVRDVIDETCLKNEMTQSNEEKILELICENVLAEEKIALSVARYLVDEELSPPRPSIRLIVSGSSSVEDIELVFNALEKGSRLIIK